MVRRPDIQREIIKIQEAAELLRQQRGFPKGSIHSAKPSMENLKPVDKPSGENLKPVDKPSGSPRQAISDLQTQKFFPFGQIKLMYDGGVVRMAEGGDPLKPVEELSPRQPEKPSDIDDAIDWIRRNVEEGIPFDDIANNLHRFSSRVIRELPTALKATARFIPGLSQISSFLIDAKPLNVGETEWLEEQNKLADETVEKISVFPKPQKMFPENDRPAGGEYLNPETQEKLTNKNMSTGNISITPEGKPSFQVNPEEKEVVGSPDIEGATQIKTNLFKKKAGWKWIQSPEGYNDISTLVSVENKGNHYYTINAEFPNGINLTRYPKAKSEPRLRPTMKGMVKLGKEVGRISVRGKEHPVYDQIINYFEGGQV